MSKEHEIRIWYAWIADVGERFGGYESINSTVTTARRDRNQAV